MTDDGSTLRRNVYSSLDTCNCLGIRKWSGTSYHWADWRYAPRTVANTQADATAGSRRQIRWSLLLERDNTVQLNPKSMITTCNCLAGLGLINNRSIYQKNLCGGNLIPLGRRYRLGKFQDAVACDLNRRIKTLRLNETVVAAQVVARPSECRCSQKTDTRNPCHGILEKLHFP